MEGAWHSLRRDAVLHLLTNLQLCAKACGSEEMTDWNGKLVTIWFDDSVMFKGEMKGGLRIKRARSTTPTPVVASDDDALPWDKD